jgi:hypothetical protein
MTTTGMSLHKPDPAIILDKLNAPPEICGLEGGD